MSNQSPNSQPPSAESPLVHGVDWAVHAGVAEQVMAGARARARQRRNQRFVAGGVVAALMIGAFLWFSPSSSPLPIAPAGAASVVVAAPALQTLPDGTVVELKEGAEISLAYSPAFRRVQLLHGEAHFLVTKNPARPFIVAVDAVEVRAVGTSFAVQRLPGQVEVVVTTGRVAVDRVSSAGESASSQSPASPHTVANLEPGNQVTVGVAPTATSPVIESLSDLELRQRLAWRVPRLEFTRTPLDEAIPMINQHSAVKIALADPALGRVRISGLLRVDNIETLFKLLETEHNIEAERRGPDQVVLRAKR